jgi:hypothetical protein
LPGIEKTINGRNATNVPSRKTQTKKAPSGYMAGHNSATQTAEMLACDDRENERNALNTWKTSVISHEK